jgi:hypothetical protein
VNWLSIKENVGTGKFIALILDAIEKSHWPTLVLTLTTTIRLMTSPSFKGQVSISV